MPYSKTGTGYPTKMHEIVEAVSDGFKAEVDCVTEKQARGQRARWYQFLGALKRDANNPPAWLDKQKAIDKARRAMAVEVVLEGTVLTFRPRDSGPRSAIFDTMKLTPVDLITPQTSKEEELLAKLMKTQEGIKK